MIAAQYGLDTFAGDVATVKRTLGRVSSPAILVGHSYGGSVITAAGTGDRVADLIYIAALARTRTRHRRVSRRKRFLTKRMGAVTDEVASSHLPMLSHPDLVIKVIRDAVKSPSRGHGRSVSPSSGFVVLSTA